MEIKYEKYINTEFSYDISDIVCREERDKPAVDKAKGSVTANLPVYSNLTDEGSREEVAEKLREAQMPEEKICTFFCGLRSSTS